MQNSHYWPIFICISYYHIMLDKCILYWFLSINQNQMIYVNSCCNVQWRISDFHLTQQKRAKYWFINWSTGNHFQQNNVQGWMYWNIIILLYFCSFFSFLYNLVESWSIVNDISFVCSVILLSFLFISSISFILFTFNCWSSFHFTSVSFLITVRSLQTDHHPNIIIPIKNNIFVNYYQNDHIDKQQI